MAKDFSLRQSFQEGQVSPVQMLADKIAAQIILDQKFSSEYGVQVCTGLDESERSYQAMNARRNYTGLEQAPLYVSDRITDDRFFTKFYGSIVSKIVDAPYPLEANEELFFAVQDALLDFALNHKIDVIADFSPENALALRQNVEIAALSIFTKEPKEGEEPQESTALNALISGDYHQKTHCHKDLNSRFTYL